MEQIRAHILIKGRLNGMNFRYKTEQQAKKLGLVGFVRNIKNARIDLEIEVQGEKDNVEKMLEWCQEEPHSSQITNIFFRYEDPTDRYQAFQVR